MKTIKATEIASNFTKTESNKAKNATQQKLHHSAWYLT